MSNSDLKFPDEYVERFDPHGFLKQVKELPSQLLPGYDLVEGLELDGNYSSIVITGMGGSFITGFILKHYLQNTSTPIILNNGYKIPKHVDKKALVICVSYSGNTEETLSSYKDARRRGCELVALSRGGKLKELSDFNDNAFIKMPSGMQPRASLGYQFGALIAVMEEIGFIRGGRSELRKASSALQKKSWDKPAQKLSEKIYGKMPIIYSSEQYYPIAYRWKTQFNENAEILALSNKFSELNHNEMMGFNHSSRLGDFHCIILSSKDQTGRMQKRVKYTKELIQEKGINITELNIKGKNLMTRMLSATWMGDLTSYYLALRYKSQPEEVEEIEDFKDKMGSWF